MVSTESGNVQRSVAGKCQDDAEIFAVVADVIGSVCGIDQELLEPGQRVQDLDIDSLFAGEIIARTERALDIGIDFRKISDDWSELTLGDLVAQFRAGTVAQSSEG